MGNIFLKRKYIFFMFRNVMKNKLKNTLIFDYVMENHLLMFYKFFKDY